MRLRQILLNLLSNACKFTKGGEVTLHFRAFVDDRHWAEFAVSDTGIKPVEFDRLVAKLRRLLAGKIKAQAPVRHEATE